MRVDDLEEDQLLNAVASEQRQGFRRYMLGHGLPINSAGSDAQRVVVVGNKAYAGRWGTFPNFLLDYIDIVLTSRLRAADSAVSAHSHPLHKWSDEAKNYFVAPPGEQPGALLRLPMNAFLKRYLGLAYDLYLCAHSAELPEPLLKRLLNVKTFEGALYEAFVIGCFAKAGFAIDFEDESDSKTSHCESTATHKETGRKFSVEAKAVSLESRRAGTSNRPPKIRRLLASALRKAADYERIVFIELNRERGFFTQRHIDWRKAVHVELYALEKSLLIDGREAPAAYVFVTNRAFMHDPGDTNTAGAYLEIVAGGFKIPTFPPENGHPSPEEYARRRQRDREIFALGAALDTHSYIPSTFDGRPPDDVFSTERI